MDSLRIGLLVALVAALVAVAWLYTENTRLRAALADAPAAPSEAAAAAQAPAPAAPAAPVVPDRLVSVEERAALVGRLSQELAAERKVWFLIDPGNREARAYQEELAATFAESGWPVEQAISRSRLKPGLLALVADETPPAYVTSALEAFSEAGLDLKTGTGYRSYYEQRRAEDESWRGLRLAEDQSWVVVIGRKGE